MSKNIKNIRHLKTKRIIDEKIIKRKEPLISSLSQKGFFCLKFESTIMGFNTIVHKK